uniref:C2H2-type domain-containing protein n=1 Tax=Heterorhabditis bacteriophora TaxID=37862 RepID=A0A1I7XFJ3_HETBA
MQKVSVVAVPQAEWSADGPRRRSISTVCIPSQREINQFYAHLFPEKGVSQHRSNDFGSLNPAFISPTPHNSDFFTTNTPSTAPVYDPGRFSPPQLDTPPPVLNQHEQVFTNGQATNVFNFEKQTGSVWNNNNKPVFRKYSVAADFFSPSAPQPVESARPQVMVDYQPVHRMQETQWNKPSYNHQVPPQQSHHSGHCKISAGSLEVAIASPPFEHTMSEQSSSSMLSPTHILNGTLNRVKMDDSPMEVDVVRKKSSVGMDRPLLTSIQHKPYQGKRHSNIASRKASLMAQKRLKCRVTGQLRSPRFADVVGSGAGGFHPYTPPPILSPMRNGSGLFWQIAKTLGHPSQVLYYFILRRSTSNFADELEALRKESWASTSSTRSADEILRKHSMDPEAYLRKASCMSDCYYDVPSCTQPQTSDAVPSVKNSLYSCFGMLYRVIRFLVEAFEFLACSQAVPRPGRNKELALHLLMENKGNIEAAVMDLLRSDTLDWEQYSIIYASSYLDSSSWTPEEVNAFQDAIYKSEKDFHQVAQELTNKSVRECVEFYYTWKKACPDDYRKLRNLRRKRQLLELNLQQVKHYILFQKFINSYISANISPVVTSSPPREMSSIPPQVPPTHLLGIRSSSPSLKDLTGLQRNYQPSAPRNPSSATGKKGAQPSADGFFHCRLCDKCFEKVKSLNAHMKSHAMKARAEAEAKAQVDAQIAAQSSHLGGNPVGISFQNGHIGISNLTAGMQGLTQSNPVSQSLNGQGIHAGLGLQQGLSQSLLSHHSLGLAHPRPQHPLLPQSHLTHPTTIH